MKTQQIQVRQIKIQNQFRPILVVKKLVQISATSPSMSIGPPVSGPYFLEYYLHVVDIPIINYRIFETMYDLIYLSMREEK